MRRREFLSFGWVVPSTAVLTAACRRAPVGTVLPLPYGPGLVARCLQGPFQRPSHLRHWSWDFGLPLGAPVVAVAAGRVLQVVDDRTATGANDFDRANRILLDHGHGRFSVYVHHGAGTARVTAGERVPAGAVLAAVGRTGTILPHVHFDYRGPLWETSHPVVFLTGKGPVAPRRHMRYRAVTAPAMASSAFVDSRLEGREFSAHGVTLTAGALAYQLPVEQDLLFTGRAPATALDVGFYLWRDGERSEYSVTTRPDADGRFELTVRLPERCRGPRWYRITPRPSEQGPLPALATLPACVG